LTIFDGTISDPMSLPTLAAKSVGFLCFLCWWWMVWHKQQRNAVLAGEDESFQQSSYF